MRKESFNNKQQTTTPALGVVPQKNPGGQIQTPTADPAPKHHKRCLKHGGFGAVSRAKAQETKKQKPWRSSRTSCTSISNISIERISLDNEKTLDLRDLCVSLTVWMCKAKMETTKLFLSFSFFFGANWFFPHQPFSSWTPAGPLALGSAGAAKMSQHLQLQVMRHLNGAGKGSKGEPKLGCQICSATSDPLFWWLNAENPLVGKEFSSPNIRWCKMHKRKGTFELGSRVCQERLY